MLSAQVRPMLKGYGNHATQLGYQKKGAVPLPEFEMQLLLQSMHKTCNNISTATPQHMLLLREGMIFSLLWQSCLSSFNAGGLRLDKVFCFSFGVGELLITHTCTCNKINHKCQTEGHPQPKLQITLTTLIEADTKVCKEATCQAKRSSL